MRERNHKMTLRLNDKEAELLNKKSQMVGVSKEQYLRMLLLGVKPKEKPTADFYNMTRELNAIGNSINQIAKVANAKGFIQVQAYEENVKKLNEVLLELSRYQILPERGDEAWLLQELSLIHISEPTRPY